MVIRALFCENQDVTSHGGGGGGGGRGSTISQNNTWGMGTKISQKNVTYYFNGSKDAT
jgi:hypothetical protein